MTQKWRTTKTANRLIQKNVLRRERRYKDEFCLRNGPLEGKQNALEKPPIHGSSDKVVVDKPPSIWGELFRKAVKSEEEGGRELRLFIELENSLPKSVLSLHTDEPKASEHESLNALEEEAEEGLDFGGFRQPASLAAFSRQPRSLS